MTYDRLELLDGLGLVPIVMGLFGIAEILNNIEQKLNREVFEANVKGLMPTRADWKLSVGPIWRGTILGFFLGILPGGGGGDFIVPVLRDGKAAVENTGTLWPWRH